MTDCLLERFEIIDSHTVVESKLLKERKGDAASLGLARLMGTFIDHQRLRCICWGISPLWETVCKSTLVSTGQMVSTW